MKQYAFKNAKFIKTAIQPKDYPVLRDLSGDILPEIAVAGRSNVGKSSLLNHLFQSPGLVKTSSTPGKTQALNFFTLNNQLAFVDLPGYGYAEVPLSVKKQWAPMIQNYLQQRESLKLILFLFDIRRMPNEEDYKLIEWISHANKSMILVLTKVDKVTQSVQKANTNKIIAAFHTGNLHHVAYSVTKNVGRHTLMAMLIDAMKDEIQEEEKEEVRDL